MWIQDPLPSLTLQKSSRTTSALRSALRSALMWALRSAVMRTLRSAMTLALTIAVPTDVRGRHDTDRSGSPDRYMPAARTDRTGRGRIMPAIQGPLGRQRRSPKSGPVERVAIPPLAAEGPGDRRLKTCALGHQYSPYIWCVGTAARSPNGAPRPRNGARRLPGLSGRKGPDGVRIGSRVLLAVGVVGTVYLPPIAAQARGPSPDLETPDHRSSSPVSSASP